MRYVLIFCPFINGSYPTTNAHSCISAPIPAPKAAATLLPLRTRSLLIALSPAPVILETPGIPTDTPGAARSGTILPSLVYPLLALTNKPPVATSYAA